MSLDRRWLAIAVGTVWWAGMCYTSALASTFLLSNGGQIEGRLLNPDQQPRVDYQIEVSEGGRLVLRAEQVQRVLTLSDEVRWYQQWLPKVPNTVEGHWAMAEQCRLKDLQTQREYHLNQILQLDPDHREARSQLGFSRVKDQWIKTDQWMQRQGYVRYRGAWRMPHDIALEKLKEEADKSQREWIRKIQNWRTWILKARGNQQQATAAIRAIEDPAAAAGLIEIIENEKDPPDLRRLCIQVLGKLRTPRSIDVFVQRAMRDPDPNIRDACLDELTRFGTTQAVWRFQALLKSADNKQVNRAGACLAVLKDPEATQSLIDALVTEHKYLYQTGGSPGQMNLGFGSGGAGGGGTFGVGGRPKVINREHKNEGVLSALVSIWPGVNFGYDQQAWKAWLADQHDPKTTTLRREP
jgi:hypothetical protein